MRWTCCTRDTPKPFVAACSTFTFLESISKPKAAKGKAAKTTPTKGVPANNGRASKEELIGDIALMSQLCTAVAKASDDDGWAELSTIGSHMAQQAPGFTSRSFGYAKLSGLIAATGAFETEKRSPSAGEQKRIYTREKLPARARARARARTTSRIPI
jgi:hypothetical protein